MNRTIATAVALAALAAGRAHAMETPKSCGPDPSILCVPYQENNSVQVTVSPDMATTVALGLHPDEKMLLNAPMTDDTSFEIKPFGDSNVLVRPQAGEVGRTATLTLFVQEPDGSQRIYPLSLVVKDKGGPQVLRYTYPGEIAAARAAKAQTVAEQRQDELINGRLKTAMFYGSGEDGINWAYECRCGNGPDLVPDGVNDNGATTVFRYKGIRSAPAFYTVAPDGHETPVVTTRVGDVYVAHVVAQVWRLRSGSEVIELRNRAYHPGRAGWGTGTVSADVVRELIPTPYTRPLGQPAGPQK